MKKNKKVSKIEAEEFNEDEELDDEIEIEDDSLEEEYDEEIEEDVIFEEHETLSAVEETPEDEEEYEDTKITTIRTTDNKFMKVFNIIFAISIIIIIIISVDVICVARYDVGPFFAIKTTTYKDGGTKVYYGLGYKVIKYNQLEGRRDTQIGFWNMPYSVTPTEIEDIDFAIEFQNNAKATSQKYYKQYLKITSTIKDINKEDNKLLLEYTDTEGGKYTLQIECRMASNKDVVNKLEINQPIVIKGTVYKFSVKNDDNPNKIYLYDCFVAK